MTNDYFGMDVSLAALAGESGVVERFKLVDCEVRGPVDLLLGDGVVAQGDLRFDAPREETLVGGEPPGAHVVLRDSFIDGSRFYGVRLYGDPGLLEATFGHAIFS